MICLPCSEGHHERCPGIIKHPSHCDCQHRKGASVETVISDIESSEADDARME